MIFMERSLDGVGLATTHSVPIGTHDVKCESRAVSLEYSAPSGAHGDTWTRPADLTNLTNIGAAHPRGPTARGRTR